MTTDPGPKVRDAMLSLYVMFTLCSKGHPIKAVQFEALVAKGFAKLREAIAEEGLTLPTLSVGGLTLPPRKTE